MSVGGGGGGSESAGGGQHLANATTGATQLALLPFQHAPPTLPPCSAWLTDPLRLDRPESMALPTANSNTWANKESLLNTFFGFACLHTGLQHPGLEAYRDRFNTSFMPFMTFLYRRGSMPGCFASHCNLGELGCVLWGSGWAAACALQGGRVHCMPATLPSQSHALPHALPPSPHPPAAKRALLFLRSEAVRMGQPYTPAQEAAMKETMDSLTCIPQQLRKHISPKPQPTIPELKSMGQWLDAPQLVQLVVKLKVRSLGGWGVHDMLLASSTWWPLPQCLHCGTCALSPPSATHPAAGVH